MSKILSVWVFSGENSNSPSAVFENKDLAFSWILKHKLTGILTQYPLNEGVYDWAIDNQFFEPSKETEFSPEFIQNFTCASQDHYHFENGEHD